MKHTLLTIVVALFSVVTYSQEQTTNTEVFKLFVEGKSFDTEACFNENTNFQSIEFENPQNIEASLELTLSTAEVSEKFDSYTELKLFNLKYWLTENEAFSNNDKLEFRFYNAKDTHLQTISVCITTTNEDIDRGASNPDFVKLPVYFATDRNYVKTDDVYEQFGNKRSDLKYGMCTVSIPHDHKMGHIESPSVWRFEFSEDPKKHVVLHTTKVLKKDEFFKSLSTNVKNSPRKSSFLFVHGYNTSFGDAAKRTAQISYDLLFEGESVFYSWPSQANVTEYTRDEANIKWAETNIKNFLEDYITRSGAEEIYLVAHSMGNRGLTRAIISLFEERPDLKKNIKEIILAAPDIDADIFKRDIAPKMVELVQKPITLYVSADDLALKASKKLHGYPRAGDSSDGIVLVDGIETIDATGIDTSFLSHSYFADTTSIISDIFDLMKTGKRAIARKRLQLIELSNNFYFKVKKYTN